MTTEHTPPPLMNNDGDISDMTLPSPDKSRECKGAANFSSSAVTSDGQFLAVPAALLQKFDLASKSQDPNYDKETCSHDLGDGETLTLARKKTAGHLRFKVIQHYPTLHNYNPRGGIRSSIFHISNGPLSCCCI